MCDFQQAILRFVAFVLLSVCFLPKVKIVLTLIVNSELCFWFFTTENRRIYQSKFKLVQSNHRKKGKRFGPDKKDKALDVMGSSSDNFSLRWNDFESSMGTSFRELRNDSEFFDVTLCCGNGVDTVPAHKVILAACSPLFRRILSCQKNHQNPLLYLKGIQLKELKAVLDFAYNGEVKIAQDSLDNFLAVAEELAIKGLTTNVKPSDQTSKKAVSSKKKRTITQEKNSNLKVS